MRTEPGERGENQNENDDDATETPDCDACAGTAEYRDRMCPYCRGTGKSVDRRRRDDELAACREREREIQAD